MFDVMFPYSTENPFPATAGRWSRALLKRTFTADHFLQKADASFGALERI